MRFFPWTRTVPSHCGGVSVRAGPVRITELREPENGFRRLRKLTTRISGHRLSSTVAIEAQPRCDNDSLRRTQKHVSTLLRGVFFLSALLLVCAWCVLSLWRV